MSISKGLFYLGILAFLIAIIYKLIWVLWHTPYYAPITFIRLTWTLVLLSIGYHLLFERGK